MDKFFDKVIATIIADFSRYNIRFNYIKNVIESITEFIKNNSGLKLYSNTLHPIYFLVLFTLDPNMDMKIIRVYLKK
jgi:hypothetical protein